MELFGVVEVFDELRDHFGVRQLHVVAPIFNEQMPETLALDSNPERPLGKDSRG